ncbi:uncharacterized protein PAC_18270 [Phialocephala subalpina]|uniref:Uncharacterized protein n=1 Tax=Phialocephala subalpina TaxID=576137 RepID=A0A1L7XTK5_9HELO|nr:uncharacterized protein PAC_18270 [Phialocephala subalpina]
MDPGFYRQMTDVMGLVPKRPEIPEEALANVGDPSARKTPPDTNWTVYSPNVTRGNLEQMQDLSSEDPRMSVGWKANESGTQEEPETGGWMSSTEQQPFMGNWTGEVSMHRYMVVDSEATPKASDQASNYPHPSLSLPHPSLNLDFRMSVTLNPKISVGATPFGHRNWISFTGGTWSGSWGSGIVLPGGQDSQIITPDGSARLETNYILQTYDQPPAHIVIKTHGWRTGPPDVLAQLADPEKADNVDPHSYKMRLFIEMETGDERYRDKVNCGMWVGGGMRKGAEVIYDAYRIS